MPYEKYKNKPKIRESLKFHFLVHNETVFNFDWLVPIVKENLCPIYIRLCVQYTAICLNIVDTQNFSQSMKFILYISGHTPECYPSDSYWNNFHELFSCYFPLDVLNVFFTQRSELQINLQCLRWSLNYPHCQHS